jgi:hypothetical protein
MAWPLEGLELVNGQIQYGPARTLNSLPTPAQRRRRIVDPNRFGVAVGATRSVVLLVGSSLLFGGILAAVPKEVPGMAAATLLGGAWLAVMLAITVPSRVELAGAELSRRLGQFRHALNGIGDEPTRGDLEGLQQYARSLQLRDEEIAGELVSIRASLDALDLAARLERGDLPVVPVPGLAPGDTCHFAAAVRFGRRRADQFGHLALTRGWLKFRGGFDISVAWSEVSNVERAGAEIIVSLNESRRLLRFACQTTSDAARGGILAQHLARVARIEAEEPRGTDARSAHASSTASSA